MSEASIAFQLVPTAFALGMVVYEHMFDRGDNDIPLFPKLLVAAVGGHAIGVYMAHWYGLIAGVIHG